MSPARPKMPTDLDASESLVDAVLDDGVVQAAIEHVGEEPTPSRIAARKEEQKAEQTETSLRSEGQRNTSMVWETTQKDIALFTIRGTVACAAAAAIVGKWLGLQPSMQMAAFVFLYGVANMVVGFYFGRTNHTRVGGPGGDSAGRR